MRDKRMRRACKTPWVITLIVTSATATAALVSGGTTSHGQDLDDVGIYNGNPTAGREASAPGGALRAIAFRASLAPTAASARTSVGLRRSR
jgi:hypothetical protein